MQRKLISKKLSVLPTIKLFSLEKPSFFGLLVFLILLFFFGSFLSITSNYGGDNDTYLMLRTFDSLIKGNGYIPSRFTGYPVAEIGIGFIAYYFGSWLNNLLSFALFLVSLILIYKTLTENKNNISFVIFLLLCVSNPVLFFDNIAPMDYSLALIFFSLGLFFLKKRDFVFSVLFFGISTGARPNFLLFSIIAILFIKLENPIPKYQKFSLTITTIFIGALFYVPVWFNNGLGLDWLTAVRPMTQGYAGLTARFIYKTWMAIGLLVLPFSIYILIRSFQKIKYLKNLKLIILLILGNLVIYLNIPADRSYLQLSMILFFFLLSISPLRNLIAIVVINVLSWFILINPFTFSFRSDNPCDYLEAISAEFKPNFSEGELFIFFEGQNESICYQDYIENRVEEINSGKKLK